MNWWLVYWIVGCLIVGGAIGGHNNECPNDKIGMRDNTNILLVAIWPALVAAGSKTEQGVPCSK